MLLKYIALLLCITGNTIFAADETSQNHSPLPPFVPQASAQSTRLGTASVQTYTLYNQDVCTAIVYEAGCRLDIVSSLHLHDDHLRTIAEILDKNQDTRCIKKALVKAVDTGTMPLGTYYLTQQPGSIIVELVSSKRRPITPSADNC